jgi:uncharacterized protein YqgQ
MKNFIKNKLRESILKEEDYFNATLPDDVKSHSKRFEGRNVVWYGDPDQMIALKKEEVEGMWGNIYYPEKMEYLTNLIINHEDKIEIECSYGIGDVTSIIDVMEEQASYKEGGFEVDYEQLDEPSSIGDEDLDDYLGSDDLYDSDLLGGYDVDTEVMAFMNKHKTSIAIGKETVETLMANFKQLEASEEEVEAFKEFLKTEVEIKNAIDNQDGDIGDFRVQLRDGHHRVMAAFEAGEEFVCVNLAKEDIAKYKGHYRKI